MLVIIGLIALGAAVIVGLVGVMSVGATNPSAANSAGVAATTTPTG